MDRQLKPYAPIITHAPNGEDDNHLCWHIIDAMKQRVYSDALAFGVERLVRAHLADARGVEAGDALADAEPVVVPECTESSSVSHAY